MKLKMAAFPYFFLLAGFLSGSASQADSPQQPESVLTEQVEVRVVSIDLDVVPKGDDYQVCQAVSAEHLSLEINGSPRKILELLPLKSEKLQQEQQPTGRLFVLAFDETFMGPRCFSGDRHVIRALSFAVARNIVEKGFRPGDRFLVASVGFVAEIRSDWLLSPAAALAALDRVENDDNLRAQGDRLRDVRDLSDWWSAWESLILGLGHYPGRKEVIILGLGAGKRIDSRDGGRLNRIGGLCQANRVRIHAARVGETLFPMVFVPFPIQSLALASGGTSWPHLLDPEVVVTDMENNGPCRFILSFIPDPADDREKLAQLRITSNDPRFTVRSPGSFLTRINLPGQGKQEEGQFVAGRIAHGVVVQAQLAPFAVDPGGKKWEAALRVRVKTDPSSDGDAGNEPLKAEFSFWQGPKLVDESVIDISPEVIRAIRQNGESEFVRLVRLTAGEVQFGVAVYSASQKTFGSARGYFDFPKLPCHDGSAWWPSDKLARVGGKLVPLPALDGTHSQRHRWVAGINCQARSLPLAKLTDPLGNVIEFPIERLVDPQSKTLDGELWIGALPSGLAPGKWSFTPPDAPKGRPVLWLEAPDPGATPGAKEPQNRPESLISPASTK